MKYKKPAYNYPRRKDFDSNVWDCERFLRDSWEREITDVIFDRDVQVGENALCSRISFSYSSYEPCFSQTSPGGSFYM